MTEVKKDLINRLSTKDAVIGIIGLGYVGLPLVLRFSEVGLRVLGLDIDPAKVAMLNSGRSYIEHIPSERIVRAQELGFRATAEFSEVASSVL